MAKAGPKRRRTMRSKRARARLLSAPAAPVVGPGLGGLTAWTFRARQAKSDARRDRRNASLPPQHRCRLSHFRSLSVARPERRIALISRRISLLLAEYQPCLSALVFPDCPPEPCAPPCMRHRALPETAGDLQGAPLRVFAPHRGLAIIGPVLRG